MAGEQDQRLGPNLSFQTSKAIHMKTGEDGKRVGGLGVGGAV